MFVHKDVFTLKENQEIIDFINKNWVVVETYPDGCYYDCSLLGADNKCTDYENRPSICKGYPFYNRQVIDAALIKKLIDRKCGFVINYEGEL